MKLYARFWRRVHDDEGLNVQVYNRCVGTRYCQNNCPYKVRRFNFFDHWKSYEGTMNMVWNPDVTVRTRGIMEKCTFCVQRIRDAKDRAKDAGERVGDGGSPDRVSANLRDGGHRLWRYQRSDQPGRPSMSNDSPVFRVLEVLNTKPAISYLSKVRNKRRFDTTGHEAVNALSKRRTKIGSLQLAGSPSGFLMTRRL